MNPICGAERLFSAIALSFKFEIPSGYLRFELLALTVNYLAHRFCRNRIMFPDTLIRSLGAEVFLSSGRK